MRVCLQYHKFFHFFSSSFSSLQIVHTPVVAICYKSAWHIFFQLLDTLPVCQDFNRQVCNRPACKFIHLSDGELFAQYRLESWSILRG